METTSKKLEENKLGITVRLTADEVQKEIDAAYKEAGKNRIAGFRPGKAPRKILENHFGGKEYFMALATDELVQANTFLAIDEQDVISLSSPDFDELDMVKEGEDFTYSFSIEVVPDFELTSYDPVQIELPSVEPTEEELQSRIDMLLSYNATKDEDGEEQLPELTDAWVREALEFESVDEFKERMADSIRMQKDQQITMLREFLVTQELAKRLVDEVPEALIRQTEQDNYRDFFHNLQKQRTTLDAYLEAQGLTPETFREEMHDQAKISSSMALALDALARHNNLTATDEEIKEEFENSGAKDPSALYEDWRKNGRLSEIRQGIVRMKASKYLFENIEVFEPGTLYPKDTEEEGTEQETKEVADKPQEVKKPSGTKKSKSAEGKSAKIDSIKGKEEA